MNLDLRGKRVFVAGDRGMVGSALVRRLASEDCETIEGSGTRADLDLTDSHAVWRRFAAQPPDVIFLAAATVGGIADNAARPVQFLSDNLQIATAVMAAAFRAGVPNLVFLGSSCIYPRDAAQPIDESALLTGPLEATNQWYALAKIAGVKLAQAYRQQWGVNYISVMPCNLYGPGDNFDPATAHVPGALMQRLHLAKLAGADRVAIWGSGHARREFLHVDDCADACVFALKHWSSDGPLNIGAGVDWAIGDFAKLMAHVVGYRGELIFDATRPEGAPRKLLDSSKIRALGWRPSIDLGPGLTRTYEAFKATAQVAA